MDISFSSGLGSASCYMTWDHGIQVLCSSGGWFPSPRCSGETQRRKPTIPLWISDSRWRWALPCGGISCGHRQLSGQCDLLHPGRLWPGSVSHLPSRSVRHKPQGRAGCLPGREEWRRAEGNLGEETGLPPGRSLLCLHTCRVRRTLLPRLDLRLGKTALAGTLPVLLLLLLVNYTGWREHRAKTEAEKKKEASHERDKVARGKEEHIQSKVNRQQVKSEVPGKAADAVCRVDGERKNCSKNPEENTGCQEFTDLGVMQRRKPTWEVRRSVGSGHKPPIHTMPFQASVPQPVSLCRNAFLYLLFLFILQNKLQKHLRNQTPRKHALPLPVWLSSST